MAPERIDPAKTVYDIRADVWSLGITLVELATGVFPYRGCVTDFEVLTQVLTSKPPRLPEDQPFSPEFRDFVQLCLQKDYVARPKYPDLLRHAFLQRAEHDSTINVGEWFRNVAVNCGIQLTSPPQQPSSVVGTPPTWTASSEQTRIPTPLGSLTEVVQAQSNQQKQTIAIAASSIPIKSTATILSPHIANEAPSNLNSTLHQQQQRSQQLLQSKLSNISLASSASSTSTAAAAAAPVVPGSTPVASSSSPYATTSSSSPVAGFDPRRSPSPQTLYLAKMQPKSAITSTSVVPVASGLERNGSLGATEQARKYKHSPFLSRRTASEYGSGSPKKESTLSSLGQSIFKNLTTSPFSQRKSLPAGESKFATGGNATAGSFAVSPPLGTTGIYANGATAAPGSNPSSPLLLLRKAHDVPGSETADTQYKHLQGNTSPIVLQRFYHQQNQLIEQQREALQQQQQQHHHQPQQHVVYGYSSPSPVPPSNDASPRPSRYSPLPSHRTVHHGVHPVLNVSSTLHQSAIPLYTHHEPATAATVAVAAAPPTPSLSGIPVYHQPGHSTTTPKHKPSSSFFNTFSRGMKSRGDKVIDRGGNTAPTLVGAGCPTTGDHRSLYGSTAATSPPVYHPPHHRGQTNPMFYAGVGSNGAAMMMSEGGSKEESGWLNSFADMKRRFASFVKLNLSNNGTATTTTTALGDKRSLKEKQLLQQQQQQLQLHHHQQHHQYATNPFLDTTPAATTGTTLIGSSSGMYAGTTFPSAPMATTSGTVHPPSAIPAMTHVLNSAASDRRHRSPDPPPRLNRGQSPLLLQRKLEQLGHTGSPLLNRRPFNSTSPSPPLPPRRGSESVPGSPQHLRVRMNYTPEPHRRPYHTTINQ